MKNNVKQTLISVIGASFIAMSIPSAFYAVEAQPAVSEVTVRIEGINDCLYYDTITVDNDNNELTAADVIAFVDEINDDITIAGLDFGYIADVNGESAGCFGGWDGWLFRVNGTEPTEGMDTYSIKNGDSIVLFYGDPYGDFGFQYPEMSYDNTNGILTFTSSDAEYDENWNVAYIDNPVAGMTVTWNLDDENISYVTDKNGQITLPDNLLKPDDYSIKFEKADKSGIPLVLRSEPNFTLSVDYLAGDVNGNRVIDAVDASIILSAYAKASVDAETGLTEKQEIAADANNDGKFDAIDASKVLSYYAFSATGGKSSFEDFLNNIGD